MSMDLTTNYLGLTLKNPIMPGASPMAGDMGMVRRLEDAGASAIVMYSLFEEQLVKDEMAAQKHVISHQESNMESLSYTSGATEYRFGPDAYLEQIRKIRSAVNVPVIASLNGISVGGWLEYALLMEQAGAYALELNLYNLPTNPDEDAATVEAHALEVVTAVVQSVAIPVGVKLSPFYSSLPHFARRVEEAGAGGVILFNRFYQPDIDPDTLDVTRSLRLSDSSELLLRLRWLAILSAQRKLSFAASGGIDTAHDAIKAAMAGAHAIQLVSTLLKRGPEHLTVILDGLSAWLTEREYTSFSQLRGSMNQARCPDPAAYERANYIHILQSWHGS